MHAAPVPARPHRVSPSCQFGLTMISRPWVGRPRLPDTFELAVPAQTAAKARGSDLAAFGSGEL